MIWILATIITLACGQQEIFESDIVSSDDDTLAKGVIFNEESTILLAEKFIQVEFLVPFPQFNLPIRHELNATLQRLNRMWRQPSVNCHLDFTTNFNSNDSAFTVDWLIEAIEQEVSLARQEIGNLHQHTSEFLNGIRGNSSPRKRRNALAAIGLFGSGVLLGGQGSCGLLGIFGTCQDKAKINAENIVRVAEYSEQIGTFVTKIKNEVNDKFYLVSDELRELRKIQQEMATAQNKNWKVVEEQFSIFEKNIHALVDCDQQLYARQQINFNYDTISALLSLVYTNIKTYRSALYAYHMNLMNSIPSLLKRYLPMSLISRESMLEILSEVASGLVKSGNRLSLAIPMPDLLSYYDAQLLKDVISLPEGLVMTLSIPLASSQTALKVYKAHVLPMPQEEPGTAIKWKTEAPYLAVSEDNSETAHLTQQQLDRCIGSSRYRICHESMATERSQKSCLSALFFTSVIDAIRVCETEKFYLPTTEKAENLGHGIWLITSATSTYSLVETNMDPRQQEMIRFPGCTICIVTLECGRQLQGPNIKIRSDLSSCQKTPAVKLTVKLPTPIQQLLSSIPQVDDLPYFTSRTEASVEMLRTVRTKLQQMPQIADNTDLAKIAEPIAVEMTMLKPSLKQHFESYLPLKMSITISIASFIGSMTLHIGFMYLYHRFRVFRNLVPRFMSVDNEKIKMKPVVTVDEEHYNKIAKTRKLWERKMFVLKQGRVTKNSGAANSPNATIERGTPKLSRAESKYSMKSNISRHRDSLQCDVNDLTPTPDLKATESDIEQEPVALYPTI